MVAARRGSKGMDTQFRSAVFRIDVDILVHCRACHLQWHSEVKNVALMVDPPT